MKKWFYAYEDKSKRLAATTKIDEYLDLALEDMYELYGYIQMPSTKDLIKEMAS